MAPGTGREGRAGQGGHQRWRPLRGRVERARSDAAREFDLEGVVAGGTGVGEREFGGPREGFRRRRRALQRRFGFAGAPGLGGDAAERDAAPRGSRRPRVQRRCGRDHGEGEGGALAQLQIARMARRRRRPRREAAARRSSSPGSSAVSRCGRVAGQSDAGPRGQSRARPSGPSTSTTASSATSGTQKSDGWVAMQCSLQPSTACRRFSPCRASQPEPGSRRLQALAMSWK